MMTVTSDHNLFDQRSVALHRRVAEKLLADPTLLNIARDNIDRWQQARDGAPSRALIEWQGKLDLPVDTIAAFVVENSERATRLRQSSPFAGILTAAERAEIYESYPARAHHPRRERNLG